MPFASKPILPVLPKPDHLAGTCQSRTLSDIEDKELRKKLRNRQSALAARERKKARMLELERKVAELQQTNKNMEDENRNLRCMLSSFLRASGCKNETEVISNLAKGNCDISININKATQKPKRMPPLIADFKPKVNEGIVHRDISASNIQLKPQQVKPQVLYSKDINIQMMEPDANSAYSNYKPVKREMQYYSSANLQNLAMRNGVTDEKNIVIKQEIADENFEQKCEVQFSPNSQINVPVAPMGEGEENSVFAQALKRKARALVLSAGGEKTAFAHQTQEIPRKRQALPSIDAVFSSPSKKSTNDANFCNNFQSHPVQEHRTLKQFEPQELIAMDSSLISNTNNGCWSLSNKNNNTSSCDPVLSRADFSTGSTNVTSTTICSELPSELTDIICDYSSSSVANDAKDGLNTLYDIAYSPLEKSGNSPDSGLGLDDDWMPNMFDFS